MASAVGSLKVLLSADIGKFSSDMRRAAGISDRQMRNIQRTAQRAFRAVAVAAAAATAAITAMTRAGLRSVDAISKQADALGMTTEALSALEHQAQLAGTSLQAVTTAQARLQRSISDANDGLSTQVRAFNALGIEVSELLNLTPEQQWRRVAQAIAQMENPTQRNAAAMQLLGRSATNLMPLLMQGAEGFDAAREEADRLGISFDRLAGNQVERANDAMLRLRQLSVGLSRQLAITMAPILEGIAKTFTDMSVEAGGFGNIVTTAFEKAVKAAGFVANAFRGIEVVWATLKVGINGFVMAVAVGIEAIVVNVVRAINRMIDIANEASMKAWEITGIGGDQMDRISESSPLMRFVSDFARATEEATATARQNLEDLLMEPLPSDGIEEWVAEVKRLSALAADEFARNRPDPGSWDGAGDAGGTGGVNRIDRVLQSLEQQQATLGMTAREIKLYELAAMGATESQIAMADGILRTIDAFNEQKRKAEKTAQLMWAAAKSAAQNIQTAFADFLFDPFEDGLKGMLKGFIDAIRRMIAEAAALKVFEALNISTGLGKIIGAPGRAVGGPVNAGQAFIVGEKGPELFVPNVGGAIIPNGGSAGGAPVFNISVTASADRDPSADTRLAESIAERVKRDVVTFGRLGYMPA